MTFHDSQFASGADSGRAIVERFADRRIEARYPAEAGADWNDVLRARPRGRMTIDG